MNDGGIEAVSYTHLYYLASVANKVYVNPEGNVDWHGIASQPQYIKGSTKENNNDVHQSVGCSVSQLTNNAALTEQVTQHQHTNQRSCGRQNQGNDNRNDDREQNFFQFGNRTKLLHLDLRSFSVVRNFIIGGWITGTRDI